ncbi:MAG: Polyprenyl synthetase [Candidatus Saccharibacteria bacterium]|nr:Polyprenyl synthetase [Candidatus Saccharibacteria bacterium]
MKTSVVSPKHDVKVFQDKLNKYKHAIEADIEAYSKQAERITLQQYGAHSRVATDAYLSVLGRGGKRIRGALTWLGYEMMGGKNPHMIVQAARAIEMIHAYILIIDDIQDRSLVRRGGPTAHVMLSDYHRFKGLAGSSDHFGQAIAMNAALTGNHAAQMVLANLPADEEARLKVVSIMNRTMVITAHGQTNDIFNEVDGKVSEDDVNRVLEWKTAHYSFLNPLHVGMVLAGADCSATDAITDYAMHAGRAFQITDDILGTFGTEFDSGKSPMDDIKGGKRTVLTVHALENVDHSDKNFLLQSLGNTKLGLNEFERCKDILQECGALKYAKARASKHVSLANQALEKEESRWSPEGTQFLRGLTQYLLVRSS